MKLKKLTALFLACAMLAGCAQSGTTASSQASADQASETSAASSVAETSGAALGSTSAKKASVTVKISYEDLLYLEDDPSVSEDTKYGAATISLSQEQFEAAGFTLGDSCDVEFSNGYALQDVPYYNGYYVKNGAPVIVAYPGASNISITLNNKGIWDEAGLKDGDSITISLAEAGKYADIQEALGQQYSFIRTDYTSDEEFCNFRALTGGSLKENFLYRGASPVDSSRNRAPYTDGLLKQIGINFIMDLADNEADIEAYKSQDSFSSDYAYSLYMEGKMVLLDMGSAYESDVYKQKVAAGAKQMLTAQGPVYIHCMEGKDRTGFVCFLFEALAGASYSEMRADYLITYKNYYKVTEDGTPEKYEAITELYFDAFASFLHGTEDKTELINADYTQDAANYLMEGGMTQEEVNALIAFITE